MVLHPLGTLMHLYPTIEINWIRPSPLLLYSAIQIYPTSIRLHSQRLSRSHRFLLL